MCSHVTNLVVHVVEEESSNADKLNPERVEVQSDLRGDLTHTKYVRIRVLAVRQDVGPIIDRFDIGRILVLHGMRDLDHALHHHNVHVQYQIGCHEVDASKSAMCS